MFPEVLFSHSNWMNLHTSVTMFYLDGFEDFSTKEELFGMISLKRKLDKIRFRS
jgi:hypothetical protein